MRRVDLTGKKFNSLLVLRRSEKTDKGGRAYWDCICDCGNLIIAEGHSLKIGKIKQCRECATKEISAKLSTHGSTHTKLYYTWTNMKTRCYNEKYDMYKNYGGKGISLCPEWNDFSVFKEWALSTGYEEGLSIDRINNEKGYSPDNCRWSTMKQQQNNRTNNLYITYNGETMTLKQWSEKLNLVYGTLQRRCAMHWPIEKILSKPNYHKKACAGAL